MLGLHWGKNCQKAIFEAAFEKNLGHEGLYVHHREQPFLSVHDDDFEMGSGMAKSEGQEKASDDKDFFN